MKQNAKIMVKENVESISLINNALEFFKKNKHLITYTKDFKLVKNDSYHLFYFTLKRSLKARDCLDLSISNDLATKLEFEELKYEDILKTFINVLLNIYDFKDFKDTALAVYLAHKQAFEKLSEQDKVGKLKELEEEIQKSFYIEKG